MNWKLVFNHGIDLHRAGKIAEAMDAYRQVLATKPDHSDALNLLGLACHQAGQSQVGAQHIAKAIQLNGKVPNYYVNLGMALRALGQSDLAMEAYRHALGLDIKLTDAWYNLANLQMKMGQCLDAAASYEQALRIQPKASDILNNLGVVYNELRRWEDAERCYRRALEITPQYADAHSNLGSLLEHLCRFNEALKYGEQAVRLQPQNAGYWINLGLICVSLDQVEKAESCYRQGLQLDPQNATGHLNLAMLLLRAGNFSAGWREYEWRLICNRHMAPGNGVAKPRWDGSPLDGRTLLVQSEQGFGDILQFARFITLVAARGGRVILECYEPLARLLGGLQGAAQVVPRGATLPEFDCYIPLLSLPLVFGTTFDSLPREVPYLRPIDPLSGLTAKSTETPRMRVGLCWSSNVQSKTNLHRIIKLPTLRPLLELRHCEFFSFQMGPLSSEIEALPADLRPHDLTSQIRDFSDTARLVAQMDLIITVDTAMAHLAGAMNVPVWTLLSCNPDWRWQSDRKDSPWYPSMRLFRQAPSEGWDQVVQAVRQELLAVSPVECGKE